MIRQNKSFFTTTISFDISHLRHEGRRVLGSPATTLFVKPRTSRANAPAPTSAASRNPTARRSFIFVHPHFAKSRATYPHPARPSSFHSLTSFVWQRCVQKIRARRNVKRVADDGGEGGEESVCACKRQRGKVRAGKEENLQSRDVADGKRFKTIRWRTGSDLNNTVATTIHTGSHHCQTHKRVITHPPPS